MAWELWCEMRNEKTLRQKQSDFAKKVALLILFAYEKGYEITFGDAWAKTGHSSNSLHYDRSAIDINLFKGGRWLQETSDFQELGEFWESLHHYCKWGGRLANDGNHFSYSSDNLRW